jgi:hypothetical protein
MAAVCSPKVAHKRPKEGLSIKGAWSMSDWEPTYAPHVAKAACAHHGIDKNLAHLARTPAGMPADKLQRANLRMAKPVDLDQALWRPLGKRMRLRYNQGGEPKCASDSLPHLSALLCSQLDCRNWLCPRGHDRPWPHDRADRGRREVATARLYLVDHTKLLPHWLP